MEPPQIPGVVGVQRVEPSGLRQRVHSPLKVDIPQHGLLLQPGSLHQSTTAKKVIKVLGGSHIDRPLVELDSLVPPICLVEHEPLLVEGIRLDDAHVPRLDEQDR
ncbi:hypothetical protein ES703_92038 [subsurface metagenome]